MTAPAAPRPIPKPEHCTADRLPDFVDLEDAPQLGPIALLQAALHVTSTMLDAQHSSVASVREAVAYEPHYPAVLLGRLVCDRCRELSELLVCYRTALNVQDQDDFDGSPF